MHASALNLFEADTGVKDKLARIKQMVVDANHQDHAICESVLKEFFMACNPSAESCSQSNDQSFQGVSFLFHVDGD